MNGCKSLIIGCVHPRLDFLIKSGFVHIISVGDLAVGLEVLEIDFHLEEIVFEGGEMKESGSIFVS